MTDTGNPLLGVGEASDSPATETSSGDAPGRSPSSAAAPLLDNGPQYQSREELLAELIRASDENVRLTEEHVELYNRIETDRGIIVDLGNRINQLATDVETLHAEVQRLNNQLDRTRQLHQHQINSIQGVNHQAITRLEQNIARLELEKLSLLNQSNSVFVALVAAQQIIIQFYESGAHIAEGGAAVGGGAVADAQDAADGVSIDGDALADDPAANGRA